MATFAGVGCSSNRNPREAGEEAALDALAAMGAGFPDFLFVFATVGYNQLALLSSIRRAVPGVPLSGCSGEGIITHSLISETNFTVCVMAIQSDDLTFKNVKITDISGRVANAGTSLANEIQPFLRDDTIGCFLFVDGLVIDFDPFQAAFEKALQWDRRLLLFGGLAADNWVSKRTYQYHDDEVLSEAISCVVMSGAGSIAWGVNHGCVPIGTKHMITRSKGNIIYEVDGIPVLELLKDYMEGDLKASWNKVSLNLSLGFPAPQEIRGDYGKLIVRYMMGKSDEEGYVTIQSDVQDGTELWIVRRDKELIKQGLLLVSEEIRNTAGSRKPKFVMQFECMGRGKVVFREQEKADLIGSLQNALGADVPWLGFYTYGEIGPVSGINCLHNFTAVVVAIF